MSSPRSARCSTRPKPRRKSSMRFPWGRLMRVHGHSMIPTLRPGELVLVQAAGETGWVPRRGEIVAVRPESGGGQAFVKRITGVPSGRVRVNGSERQLADGEYFVRGDQPDHSVDSRIFGPVTRKELVGRVRVRVWPWKVLSRAHVEEGPNGQGDEVS